MTAMEFTKKLEENGILHIMTEEEKVAAKREIENESEDS